MQRRRHFAHLAALSELQNRLSALVYTSVVLVDQQFPE
jgi:hypothetical protein